MGLDPVSSGFNAVAEVSKLLAKYKDDHDAQRWVDLQSELRRTWVSAASGTADDKHRAFDILLGAAGNPVAITSNKCTGIGDEYLDRFAECLAELAAVKRQLAEASMKK